MRECGDGVVGLGVCAEQLVVGMHSCGTGVQVPALYTHHVHSRNKYLSRLGIRPLGGPRLQSDILAVRTSAYLAASHAMGIASEYDPSLASVPPPPDSHGIIAARV